MIKQFITIGNTYITSFIIDTVNRKILQKESYSSGISKDIAKYNGISELKLSSIISRLKTLLDSSDCTFKNIIIQKDVVSNSDNINTLITLIRKKLNKNITIGNVEPEDVVFYI